MAHHHVVLLGLAVLVVASCAPTPPPPSPVAVATPDAALLERGKVAFTAKGCAACHTFAAVPGATGTTGPRLDGIGAVAASRKPGLDAAAYLRESMLEPGAFVAPGYQPIMPTLVLSEDEVRAIIALLLAQS